MPKYVKKPVVIEAEQWSGNENHYIPGICRIWEHPAHAHVHTIHDNQLVFVEAGDWIIPEPDGIHFYGFAEFVPRLTLQLSV